MRRLAGILLVLCVCQLWVTSAMLMRWLFLDSNCDRPLLVTFLNTALFSVFLLVPLLARCHGLCGWRARHRQIIDQDHAFHVQSASSLSDPSAVVDEQLAPLLAHSALHHVPDPCPPEVFNCLHQQPSVIHHHHYQHYSKDQQPSDMADSRRLAEHVIHWDDASPVDQPRRPDWRRLFGFSWLFCFLWLAANASANWSLRWTDLGTQALLSSTSTLWTLLAAFWFGMEPLTPLRLLAVLLSMTGVLLVNWTGIVTEAGWQAWRGNALAILAAMFYACYTLVLKVCLDPTSSPSRSRIEPDEPLQLESDHGNQPSTFLFFGVLGLETLVVAPLLLSMAHFLHWERFTWSMEPDMAWILLINGLVGTCLSEYLWAQAVLLTGPFAATVGMGMTVPLSFLMETLVCHSALARLVPGEGNGCRQSSSAAAGPMYPLGACCIMIGFALVHGVRLEILQAWDQAIAARLGFPIAWESNPNTSLRACRNDQSVDAPTRWDLTRSIPTSTDWPDLADDDNDG